MEFNIRDPITNILNMKMNKYRLCDSTFSEEDNQTYFNHVEHLDNLTKFNLFDLKRNILMYQTTNLKHPMIDRIRYISNYLRIFYFLLNHYYEENVECFKKSIFEVYYNQIMKIYFEYYLIEKKHYIELFLFNNNDLVPIF